MGKYVSKFDAANAKSDELYDTLVNAKPIIEYKQKSNKAHIKGLAEAYAKIQLKDGEQLNDMHSGLEKLVDAYIAYGKKAGIPVSDNKDHRHQHYGMIQNLLERYAEQQKIGREGLLKKIKLGELNELLDIVLNNAKRDDHARFANYHLNKLLPSDKDDKFYESLAHSYAKAKGKSAKFTKGDLAALTQREALIHSLSDDLANQESYEALEDQQKPELKKAA